MYSVMLHEATHSLGFLSLIRFDGLSAFTPTAFNFPYYNYYHRYDLFLHDKNGNPLLSAPVASCAISNLTFAPASASVIGAGMATSTLAFSQNSTNCSDGAKYIGSTTATVYTPYYFEPGSSLSHFEDMCSGPYTGTCVATYTPGNNDLYFVMANFTDAGSCFVKRHPTPEERLVLCDLGYSVNTSYGGTVVAGSSYTYAGGACSPSNIIGVNDGFLNGQFTLQVVAISSTVISFSTLTSNDTPSTGLSVSCMELVTNNATLSVGTTDFSVTVQPGGGLVVLKYIPRNSLGQIGNATFVFINFIPTGCNSCGIVNNGGFEYSTPGQNNCGLLQNIPSNPSKPKLDCWYVYGTNYTADLLTTICPSLSLELGVNTLWTSPPVNTVALGAATNTNAIGLTYAAGGSTGAIVNSLNSPLVNGQTYQVSFWVINYSNGLGTTNLNPQQAPVVLTLASSTLAINPLSPATLGFPNGLNSLTSFTIPSGNTWSQVTNTFVYSQANSSSHIVLGINSNLSQSPATFTPGPGLYYCFIDEVSIIELPGANFSITNNTICSSASLNNLAQFTGTTSGTFSGPGVSFDGTMYHFNSPATISPGVYGVAFTYSATNCMKTLYQSVVVENCCNSSSIPSFTGTTICGTCSPAFVGPMKLPNSFTLAPGASLMLNGEFLISPGTSITVSSGAQLILIGAHLYGCINMWQGIDVLDGGYVVMQELSSVGNMIEDAEIAVRVSNNTSSGTVLNISSTVFNKNYIDIDLSACPNSSFVIHSNVFTSRYFSFTSSTWPQAGLADLRSTASGTNVLYGPYELQSKPLATLKSPRLGEYPLTAIRMASVGTTSGTYPSLTFSSARIGYTAFSTPQDLFNLFDCHRNFIDAHNSNLKLINNVFQNTVRTSTLLPQKLAMISFSATTANKSLDLSASQVNIGNRFYDFHKGIHALNASDLYVENAIFRSSEGVGTSTMGSGWGKDAISAVSSAFRNYIVNNNEFNNTHHSIVLGTVTGTINSIAIQSNTFSPTLGTTSTATLVNLLNRPIGLSSIFQVYSPSGSNGITINDNLIYRAYNGIGVNGFGLQGTSGACGEQLSITNNTILIEEVTHTPLQWGIAVTNNLPLYSGTGCPWPSAGSAGFRSVKDNTVSLFNGSLSTTKIALFHTFNSAGISAPPLFMTCNDASDAHEGFAFEGWQQGVYWRGNKMDNLARGMILKNGGVIGPQGTQAGTPSDNEWLGAAWSTTNNGIYTSASQATNSPIIRRTSPSQFDPPFLDGSPQPWSYFGGNGLTAYTGTSTFSCSVNYTQMPSIILPNEEEYDSENLLYMAQKAVFRALHYNEDLRNAETEYSDFYSLFSGSAMETIVNIEAVISGGDFTGAETLLSGLDPDELNAIEQHYFNFYILFLRYIENGELDSGEHEDLNTLCALCPGTDGVCIIQARALYQLVNSEPYEAEPCAGDEGSRKAPIDKPSSFGNTKLMVNIYPNPTTGSVTIRVNKEVDKQNVIVTDISGRQIFKREFTSESSTFKFFFELEPGIYFFTISNGHENITKKVIVTK